MIILYSRLSNRIYILILIAIFSINISACTYKQTASNNISNKEQLQNTVNNPDESSEVSNNNVNTDKPKPVVPEKPDAGDKAETPKKNGIVIVIDPGHGEGGNPGKEPIAPGSSEMKIKDGEGGTGVITKTPEYVVNRKVAFKLKALLETKGFTVIMTKTKDSEDPGNVERAETGNKNNADLVIRIHADSYDGESVKGASMLIPAAINSNTKSIYSDSKRYGQIILNTLIKEVGMKDRGLVERSDLTGFNWSKVPVILVEMGFLSNPDEDKLLCSDAYESKIAKALSDGIVQALTSK